MYEKKRLLNKKLILIKAVVFLLINLFFISCENKKVEISNQISKEIYLKKDIKVGDTLIFEWEHSFEHVLWKEFYKLNKDLEFDLFTIVVEGFGAGIPAEMDCTYRFENNMIYMENIKGSKFKEFNWINSQKQLKKILINNEEIIKGQNLPERKKIKLKIT